MDRVFNGLEQAEDTASSLYAVTSEVRNIQEEYGELQEARDRFSQAANELIPDEPIPAPIQASDNPLIQAEIDTADQVSTSPEISPADEIRGGASDSP